MKRAQRYGLKSLEADFPNEAACLAFIFEAKHSYECSCGGKYKPVKGRRQYQCSKCRFQIAPTAGTIFHKSDTPLQLWFKAILMFANAKSGLSAKELERQLEVTYKTAWRMLTLIRKALKKQGGLLTGVVETDAAYFGGVTRVGKGNKGMSKAYLNKNAVMGAVERGGSVKADVVKDISAKTIERFLKKNVNKDDSILMTDSARTYEKVASDFDRFSVNHSKGQYVNKGIYTNTMEAFWSHVKRSIKGTHKAVSKQYLQSYLDGFVFHYNNRHSDKERFAVLLGTLLRPAR